MRTRAALIMLTLVGLTAFSSGASNAAVLTGRPGIDGVSAVLNEGRRPEGATCRPVRVVVVIGGEEAKITRTLCRAIGATGYIPVALQAAQ